MLVKINNGIKYIILFHIVFLGVIFATLQGFDIPLIQPIVGFLYLTLIPGSLILMGLKIENLPKSKYILYASGLSLVFLMFGGVLLNQTFFYLNINYPLSLLPLTAFYAITITTIILFFVLGESLNYFPPHKFPAVMDNIRLNNLFSFRNNLLSLLLILAILGMLIYDGFYNNLLLLFFFVLVTLIFGLIAFDKVFPKESYPLVLFVLSFSLIQSYTFISSFPVAYNLDREFYFSTLIYNSKFWNSSYPSIINALLSITMIPPIYSLFSGWGMNWTYKIIFTFFQALIPLTIYWIVKDYLGSKRALVSSFFFLTFFTFLGVIIWFRREVIALFFVSMILLTLNDRLINIKTKQVLFILFLISLPISHYGISIEFSVILILATIFFYFLRSTLQDKKRDSDPEYIPTLLKPMLIIFFTIFLLIWYCYSTSQLIFNIYTQIFDHFLYIFNEYLDIETKSISSLQMLGVGLPPAFDILATIRRYLLFSIEFLYVTGFFGILFLSKKFPIRKEYLCVIISSFVFFGIVVSYPNLTMFFTLNRFVTPILFIGAPLVIIGFETIMNLVIIGLSHIPEKFKLKFFFSALCKKQIFTTNNYLIILICLFLIPNFLFSSGVINAVMKISDAGYSVHKSVPLNRWEFDTYYYTDGDVKGAKWVANYVTTDMSLTYDELSGCLVDYDLMLHHNDIYKQMNNTYFSLKDTIPIKNYVFLRHWNVRSNQIMISGEDIPLDDATQIRNAIYMKNSIYYNGDSIILSPSSY